MGIKSDWQLAYGAGSQSVTGLPVWAVSVVAIVIGTIARHYVVSWYVTLAIFVVVAIGMAKLLPLARKGRKDSPDINQ